ncbi:MAG: hypothetical protein ACQETZ_05570 [Candidatus Fermentibacterota bacterium]
MIRAAAAALAISLASALLGCCANPEGAAPPTPSTLQGVFSGDTTGHPEPPALGHGAAVRQPGPPGKGGYVCLIDLWWAECPDSDFSGYLLYRSGQPGIEQEPATATLVDSVGSAGDTTLTDDDVDWSRQYFYALRTRNHQGSSAWSNEISLMTPNLPQDPPTPSTLAVDTVGYSLLQVSWTRCPDVDFSSYDLYSSEDPGIEQQPSGASLEQHSESVLDTVFVRDAMPQEFPLYMALRTTDQSGNEAWSNEVLLEAPEAEFTVTDSVDVGDLPEQMALLPGGQMLYVTCCSDPGQVWVIDTESAQVVAVMDMGGRPFGVCALPDGERVYVSIPSEDRLAVIETSTNTVVDTVWVSGRPLGLASHPDGDRVLAACYGSRQAKLVDVAAGQVTDSLDLEWAPWNVVFEEGGSRAYLACPFQSGALCRIEMDGFTQDGYIDLEPGLVDAALSPGGGTAFVSCWNTGMIYVVGTAGMSFEAQLELGGNPGMMTPAVQGSPATCNQGTSQLQMLDPGTWDLVLELRAGEGLWCPVYHQGSNRFFAADYEGGAVYLIEETYDGRERRGAGMPPRPGTSPKRHIEAALGDL